MYGKQLILKNGWWRKWKNDNGNMPWAKKANYNVMKEG